MKKRYLIILILLIGLLLHFTNPNLENITGEITTTKINSFVNDSGDLKVYFCPTDDCETLLINFIDSAKISIHCALFDIGLSSLQNKLLEKSKVIDTKIVTDNQYLKKFNNSFVRADSWGLMHNKFCIVDGKKIFTGSMNPTKNGVSKNNNNFILIKSKVLATNYESEFQEMWSGTFKKGGLVLNPKINLKTNQGDIQIENYFCPEDYCAVRVKSELKKAKESIYFMVFSFTHQGIANVILLKKLDNLTIQGVMEARQISKYSQYDLLKYQGINIVKDKNKNNLHHKVFIVDRETVITGSFNPTNGGDSKNDENILIIHNKNIAEQFLKEFDKMI